MKHKRFKQAKDNEWIQPIKKGYLMACCDCALVHRVDFRIVTDTKTGKQSVQLKASRSPKYTASQRKKLNIKVSLK